MNTEDSIQNSMAAKTTDELLSIWIDNDRDYWSDAAFQAVKQALIDRGVELPEQKAILQAVACEQGPVAEGFGMKNIVLDDNEHIVASLVRDDPEQLYKHRNQIAAITNKRLLFIRHTGISRSFEGSYAIHSIDIRTVERARQVTHIAIGGLLAGIILLLLGIGIAYSGATFRLIGPGVVFIPLITIPSGLAFIFGFKRRVVVFETTAAKYKWVSAPLEFRKTSAIAETACKYFMAPRQHEITGDEPWLTEQSPAVADAKQVCWYHYVVIIVFPYIAVLWGVYSLFSGRKRSGLLLLCGSIVWYIIIMGVALLVAPPSH